MRNGAKPNTAVLCEARGARSPAQVTTLNNGKGKQDPQVKFSITGGLRMKVMTAADGDCLDCLVPTITEFCCIFHSGKNKRLQVKSQFQPVYDSTA